MCFNIILPPLPRSPVSTHSPSLLKPCPLPHVTHSLTPPPSFMIWAPEFYLVGSENHDLPSSYDFQNFPPTPHDLDPNIFSALHYQNLPAFILLLMWETKFSHPDRTKETRFYWNLKPIIALYFSSLLQQKTTNNKSYSNRMKFITFYARKIYIESSPVNTSRWTVLDFVRCCRKCVSVESFTVCAKTAHKAKSSKRNIKFHSVPML